MKLAIAAILMGPGLCYGQESEPLRKSLSVCEVLQQRIELSGRFETISGGCKTAAFKLTTPGTTGPNGFTIRWTWPNFISLEYAENKSGDESARAPFEVDWLSIRQTERQAKRQRYYPASDRLFETFTGLLVTFDRLDLPAASPGAPILKRPGFGPDAPAKLLIKSEADVVVIRKP
jgi:hypothetical protein